MSSNRKKLHTYSQDTPYASPWSRSDKVRMLMWEFTWMIMCAWTPKPFNKWRLLWLWLYGTKIQGYPFVHQRAKVAVPWNLALYDRACLGDGAVAYSLGKIVLMEDSTVAQEAYLCTGTHDFGHPARPLQTGEIVIGRSAFIGARAFVMPGVNIGDRAIVGACSVVTKNVGPNIRVAGNPAREIQSG